MRIPRGACFALLLALLLAVPVFALPRPGRGQQTATTSSQPPPQRDPQALAVLQVATAAMGRSMPADSTASGTVTTVAGSLTESGSATILTRGTNQTSEQIQTLHGFTAVYSNGQASQIVNSVHTTLSSELASSNQSGAFPLALLAGVVNNQDSCYLYVGLESLNGANAHHLQFWNSFGSQPKFQFLAPFTRTDIWIDSVSGLPQRISQMQKAGRGSEPRIQLDTYYSNYQNVNGVLYPFSIQKSINGSPWLNITVTSVAFNTGLTDANFPVQ
jgi:hypothetical protein